VAVHISLRQVQQENAYVYVARRWSVGTNADLSGKLAGPRFPNQIPRSGKRRPIQLFHKGIRVEDKLVMRVRDWAALHLLTFTRPYGVEPE
jgi:hypothetical protein